MKRWMTLRLARPSGASSLFGVLAETKSNPPSSGIQPVVDHAPPATFNLKQLSALAVERNPILAQAAFRIDAANGRTHQSGLRPNPVLSVSADELGDRTGTSGIWTPMVSQEFVRGGKLRIARAAAGEEVDQASLGLASKRLSLLGDVRTAYFGSLTLASRIEILDELVDARKRIGQSGKRSARCRARSRLDVVQLEVDRERVFAEREATLREYRTGIGKVVRGRRCCRNSGSPGWRASWTPRRLSSTRNCLSHLMSSHPDILSARRASNCARLLVDRACPTHPERDDEGGGGYTRQGQNRSNDWMVGVTLPIPVNDRNQGNVRAALADLGEAAREVDRVENSLRERLATAFRQYDGAKERAEALRKAILPRAQEAYKLADDAYRRGQFDFLKVMEAQRSVGQARLEANRELGDAWLAAAAISALALFEEMPDGHVAEETAIPAR